MNGGDSARIPLQISRECVVASIQVDLSPEVLRRFREELLELLSHALAKAGNASLMTNELMDTLVDHAAGNYRVLMTMAGELLMTAFERELTEIDEKLYLDVFQARPMRRGSAKARRT